MAIVSMKLPWGNPQPVDDVIEKISRKNEADNLSRDPRNITEDIRSTLDGLVAGATTGDPVMCLSGHVPYFGLEVAVGYYPEDIFYGKAYSDGTGLGMLIDNVAKVQTDGSESTSDPFIQIGEITHSNKGLISLLCDFPNPLELLKRDTNSVEVGQEAIEARIVRLAGPWRFAALMALKSADVVVDCGLEDEDQTEAREALYWAIARFAAYHSEAHAVKHSAYPLVVATHVLHPDEDELRTKPREMVAEHLDHMYHDGLQRVLVDRAIDWLVDQTQGSTNVAPRQIVQTYPYGK